MAGLVPSTHDLLRSPKVRDEAVIPQRLMTGRRAVRFAEDAAAVAVTDKIGAD
jgi:hypothetical protein